jgi:uncharacterized protein (TIGR02266 family)
VSDAEGPTRSRRRHLRVPVAVAIVADDGSTAYAMNLSAGGMCLQTREELETGRRIELRFRIPVEKLITTRAEVVWADCEATQRPWAGLRYCECGLKFLDLSDRDRHAIEQFVDNRANFWPDEDPEEL